MPASNQIGTPETRPTWMKSVTMYGALGRKRSHAPPSPEQERLRHAAAVAVVQGHREQERDPGQEQVPGEKAVVAPVRIAHPEGQ